MDVLDKAEKILQRPVCDHCLGRQFGQLLSGYTNEERGALLRASVAMSLDKSREEAKESGRRHEIDTSNFAALKFHNVEMPEAKREKCSVCGDFFPGVEKWVSRIKKAARNAEIRTFVIGTKLPFELVSAEESLWEKVGIDFCEPLKAEINREVGKQVEQKLKMKFRGMPDANFILNIAEKRVAVELNPIFIYGEYQKLVRGIPQTKWPSRKYRTSVEDIIAKPFMAATRAAGHKLHGLGREDIDARCLGWRPFVLELLRPKRRGIDLKKLARKIDKRVRVRSARFSGIAEVRKIKESRAEKTYSMIVECAGKIQKNDLKKLKSLKQIRQKTPERVLHRRADKYRKRSVRSLSYKILSSRKFRAVVRCDAGLYVKELVSGDNGRTQPSVSSLLGVQCKVMQLDVTRIHAKMQK